MPNFEAPATPDKHSQDLIELGIEANKANLEILKAYQENAQCNESERELFDLSKALVAGDNESEGNLRELMDEKGIKQIKHCEGPSLWDHLKKGLEEINESISDENKSFYKVLFLYHDIGKTDPEIVKANAEKNKNPINKQGQYNIAFVGHADFSKMSEGTDKRVEKALAANNFSPEQVEVGMWILENHMQGGIIEKSAKLKSAAKIYNDLKEMLKSSKTMDAEEVFKDLFEVLKIDGQATMIYDRESGLEQSEKKAGLESGKIMENIGIYNDVMSSLSDDNKIKSKQEQTVNQFFNKITNYEDLDPKQIEDLKAKLKDLAEAEEKKAEIPPELKKMGRVLRDKMVDVAANWEILQEKKGNKKALQGILSKQIGLDEEQSQALIELLQNL